MGPTRWVTLGFAVMGILTAITVSKALASLTGTFKIPDYALLGPQVTISTAVAWIGSLGVAVWFYRQEKWHTLATETAQEIRKVIFPTWGETKQATIVVVITTIIIALILYSFDAVWSKLTAWIYT